MKGDTGGIRRRGLGFKAWTGALLDGRDGRCGRRKESSSDKESMLPPEGIDAADISGGGCGTARAPNVLVLPKYAPRPCLLWFLFPPAHAEYGRSAKRKDCEQTGPRKECGVDRFANLGETLRFVGASAKVLRPIQGRNHQQH